MCDILEKQQGLSVVNPHGLYIPMNRMGINASSDEKELAQEFIETMLSDEIQQAGIHGGASGSYGKSG